jgi:hypothetical protein
MLFSTNVPSVPSASGGRTEASLRSPEVGLANASFDRSGLGRPGIDRASPCVCGPLGAHTGSPRTLAALVRVVRCK